MGNYFTEGLILRHLNFREADRLVSIYSAERGLINVVAKASRKISSKLAGSLEPFTLAKFMIVKGKKYDTVASSEIIDVFRDLKSDLKKIRAAIFFADIVMSTAKEMQRDAKLYDFLVSSFMELKKTQSDKKQVLNWRMWIYVWQYLAQSGYQPELYTCRVCQAKIKPEILYFNYKKGGLVCRSCGSGENNVVISQNLVKIFRLILADETDKCQQIKITPDLRKEFILHTKNYFSYITERPLDMPFFK